MANRSILVPVTLPFALWYSGRPGNTPLGGFLAALHGLTALDLGYNVFLAREKRQETIKKAVLKRNEAEVKILNEKLNQSILALAAQVVSATLHGLSMFLVQGRAKMAVLAAGILMAHFLVTWVLPGDDDLGIISAVVWGTLVLLLAVILVLAAHHAISGKSAIASEFPAP